jgi:hypothetical protein
VTTLASGCTVQVDNVDQETWYRCLESFDDANVYQTWSYECIRSGESNMSHLLLKRGGHVVAASQVRITKLPLTNIGVAYVRWGPLWRAKGGATETAVFRLAIRALRDEYAVRRGLSLRILPYAFEDQRETIEPILTEEQFGWVQAERPQRTLVVSLQPSMPELRKGLDQKWRNCLNRAEKNSLEVRAGTGDELFGVFAAVYAQMHARKRFVETSDVGQFRRIQKYLPEPLKMQLAIAFKDGKPAAGVVCSKIGDTGVYLFGGTSDAGLDTHASYLLQWHILTWLKARGAVWYNLHGINPAKNPGTYRFKTGLCGRNGKDLHYLGTYDFGTSALRQSVFRLAASSRWMYRKGRSVIGVLRPKTG